MKRYLFISCCIMFLLSSFITSCDRMIVSDIARKKTIESQFPNSKVVINHTDSYVYYYAVDTTGGEIHMYQIVFYTNSDKINSIQNL